MSFVPSTAANSVTTATSVAAAAQADRKTTAANNLNSGATSTAISIIMKLSDVIKDQQFEAVRKEFAQIDPNDPKYKKVRQIIYSPTHPFCDGDFNLLLHFKALKLRALAGNPTAQERLRLWTQVKGITDPFFPIIDLDRVRTPTQFNLIDEPLFYINIAMGVTVKLEKSAKGEITFRVERVSPKGKEIYFFQPSNETRVVLFFIKQWPQNQLENAQAGNENPGDLVSFEYHEKDGRVICKASKFVNPLFDSIDKISLKEQTEEMEDESNRYSRQIYDEEEDLTEGVFDKIVYFLENNFVVYSNKETGDKFINCVDSPEFFRPRQQNQTEAGRNPFGYHAIVISSSYGMYYNSPKTFLGLVSSDGSLTTIFKDYKATGSFKTTLVPNRLHYQSDNNQLTVTFHHDDKRPGSSIKYTRHNDFHDIAITYMQLMHGFSSSGVCSMFDHKFKLYEVLNSPTPQYCLKTFKSAQDGKGSTIIMSENGGWTKAGSYSTTLKDGDDSFLQSYTNGTVFHHCFSGPESRLSIQHSLYGDRYTLKLLRDSLNVDDDDNLDYGIKVDKDKNCLWLRQPSVWYHFKRQYLQTTLTNFLLPDLITMIDRFDTVPAK